MPRLLLSLTLTLALALPATAGTSNSLMDVTPDGKRLVVANTDSGTVTVIDPKGRAKLHEVAVGDHPEGVSWVGNGPLALVTVWGDDRLVFVDAEAGKVAFRLAVDDEPYGVVVTKDGRRAFVTHDYPGTVAEIDVEARKVLRTFKAGSCVRGIALSHDENTIHVTEFYTAKLIALDRATGKVTDTWVGQESDNLCRNVVLHPTWAKAYLPHLRSRVSTVHARGSIFGQLAVCDLTPPKGDPAERRRAHSADTFNGVQVVANPWEIALTPDGSRMYMIYAGTDDLNVFAPVDDSYRDASSDGRPISLQGKHPKAIRVSPDGKEVYIYNALDFAVGVYDTSIRKKLASITTCDPPHTKEWVRGKELFVSAKSPMGGVRWISCSSCHPDGLGDGRVWQNGEGDRRTPHLFGLAHTHPLHWSADRDEVQDFEYTIRGKLMQGRGLFAGRMKQKIDFEPIELETDLAGKSADLDALAIYTNAFEPRPSPHPPGGRLSPEAQRGKSLFFAESTGCAKCHSGPYFTDSALKKPFNLHDVGTGDSPREMMGPRYDTPTLLGIYRNGPYLHDGRAKTLRDVLTTCNKDDRHGKTSHLKPAEVDDLVAFLRSLPYEPLPAETPNTVPYRPKKKP
jgi:YVTN family beta-propeller protein